MNQSVIVTYRILIPILLTFFVYSCEDSDIHGPGKTETEIRTLERFHSVSISDNIETHFHFRPGADSYVELHGGSKLLPKISTVITDSVLYLKDNNTWQWLRNNKTSKIIAHIYTDTINSIRYDGYADIFFADTLRVSKFRFESVSGMGYISLLLHNDSTLILTHTGAPDVYIAGRGNDFYLFTHSHGNVKTFDFNTNHTFVHSRGTANCYVSPFITIAATIEYMGNVYYKNNPDILWVVEKNKGKLIKVD